MDLDVAEKQVSESIEKAGDIIGDALGIEGLGKLMREALEPEVRDALVAHVAP